MPYVHFGELCQCPLRAGPHFYAVVSGDVKEVYLCQCPLRAGPHFYVICKSDTEEYQAGVNALYGRDLIST